LELHKFDIFQHAKLGYQFSKPISKVKKMSVLSDPQNALYQAQLAATAQCQNYFYKNGEAGFDSVNHMAETRPTALNEILNIVGFDSAADVDNAIKVGLTISILSWW
jgi:hypothetical protein